MATLRVHVQPGAKRNESLGYQGGVLRLRIAAPPVEGKANKALVVFLADLLGVPKRDVRLVIGETSRDKVVMIEGTSDEDLARRLQS